MKFSSSPFSALVSVAVCVLCGCASTPQGGVEGRATEVPTYDSSALNAGQYEVVGRLWGDSWRSAFWVPTYPSEAEAIASVQTEAVRLGADGLINVYCLDQRLSKWFSSQEPAFLCYGVAIRLVGEAPRGAAR